MPAQPLAVSGSTVVVPVNIDTARPPGSQGMLEAMLALHFDPRLYTVAAADVQLGTIPSSGSGWQLNVVVNNQTGEIGIDLFSATPIATTAGGSLVTVTLQALGMAPAGAPVLDLVTQVNPTGKRVYRTSAADAGGAFVLETGNV